MAAPTKAANMKKALANGEPSTHGTKQTSASALHMSAFGGKADITCHSIDREPLAVNLNRWKQKVRQ